MKTKNLMKKILSVALLAVFMFTMNLGMLDDFGVKEAKGDTVKYEITIKDSDTATVASQIFTAYKLFDLSYAGAAHSYTVNKAFKDYVYTDGGTNYGGANSKSLVDYVESIRSDDSKIKLFASTVLKDIRKELKTPSSTTIDNTSLESKSNTPGGGTSTTIDVTELGAGYYLVTGTATHTASKQNVATMCMLDSTNPKIDIQVKTDVPDIDKVIVKSGKSPAKGVSAGIGDTVTFKITGTVPYMEDYTGSYMYEIHDAMTSGLTFGGEKTIEVKIGETTYVPKGQTGTPNNNIVYTEVNSSPTSFKLTLDLKKMQADAPTVVKTGETIEITYTATLNNNALSTKNETNKAKLNYSNNPASPSDTVPSVEHTVYVYDYSIDVDKYTGDHPGTKLAGAEFVLSKASDFSDASCYKWDTSNSKVTWVAEAEADKRSTAIPGGNLTNAFKGLPAGTYYLKETKAPAGYNLLSEPVKVVITETFDGTGKLSKLTFDEGKQDAATLSDENTQISHAIKVQNNTGSELPSTGGMGTTIFYIVGGALMVGALVLLITKKKMSSK